MSLDTPEVHVLNFASKSLDLITNEPPTFTEKTHRLHGPIGTDFCQVIKKVSDHADSRGFFVSRQTNSFPSKRNMDLFGQTGVIQRGNFYCGQKNEYPYSLPFTYCVQISRYVIKPILNIKHSHSLQTADSFQLHGRIRINREQFPVYEK